MKLNDSILVTGGRGFVGKNLIKKLKDLGFENIKIPSRDCDLRHQHSVWRLFEELKPKYVFHLAAVVGGIKANIENPYKFLYDNLIIQSNVIDQAIQSKVEKFINLGSSCIYPKDYIQPLKEEYLLNAPLEPTNEGYALGKIIGLKLAEYANKQFDTRFINLMPTNLYGPGDHYDYDKSHALSAMILKVFNSEFLNPKTITVWGSGQQKREWLHVNDLVDCMLWAMDNLEKTDTFLNVGTGVDTSMNELARMTIDAFGFNNKEFEIINDLTKPDGMMEKRLDVSKINSLGWKSKINLNDGLKMTVKNFLETHEK